MPGLCGFVMESRLVTPCPADTKLQTPPAPALVADGTFKDSLAVDIEVPSGAVPTLEYSEYSLFSYSWKPVPVEPGCTRIAVPGLSPSTRYAFRLTLNNAASTATSAVSSWYTTLSAAEDEKKRAEVAAAETATAPKSPDQLADVVVVEPPVDLTDIPFPVIPSAPTTAAASSAPEATKSGELDADAEVKALTARLQQQEVDHIATVERLKRDLAT